MITSTYTRSTSNQTMIASTYTRITSTQIMIACAYTRITTQLQITTNQNQKFFQQNRISTTSEITT